MEYEIKGTKLEKGLSNYNPMTVEVKRNGTVFISSLESEHIIYLYPDQAIQLKKIMRKVKSK